MRRNLCAGAVLVAACASLVLAQDAPRTPKYDPKSEVCLKGKVADVRAIPDWMGHEGVNVTLETQPTQLVHVDIAPSSFLKAMDFPIAPGDDLEVTGTYGRYDGTTVFLARQLKKQRVTLSVRDPAGTPVW